MTAILKPTAKGTEKYSVELAGILRVVADAVGDDPNSIEQTASVLTRTNLVSALNAADCNEPTVIATV